MDMLENQKPRLPQGVEIFNVSGTKQYVVNDGYQDYHFITQPDAERFAHTLKPSGGQGMANPLAASAKQEHEQGKPKTRWIQL